MQRPWNKASEVIYSLSTASQSWKVNMNICSYVVPISMKPKKYMIALDPNTKTYQNFKNTDTAILQILTKDCKKYVRILWKQTGYKVNKEQKLEQKLKTYKWQKVLRDAAVYLEVQKADHVVCSDADHELFIVDVVSWTYNRKDKDFLTTEDIF